MAKKEEKSFRIVIDKRIVKAFDEIPETFSIKDVIHTAKIPHLEQKSVYDVLERMVIYGLIHKAKSKGYWYKEHEYRNKDGFKQWLIDYYKQIKSKKDD